MSDPTSTPRRPIVPGPSGIAAKAIAVRERVAQAKPGEMVKMSPEEFAEIRATQRVPVQFPVTSVGKLATGIAGVMSEVGTIQKTGFNKFHNYAYATLQDLLFAVTPLMGKHGVVVIQNEMERNALEGGRVQVTYEFSIFHTSGEIWPEKPRFTGMAIGKDSKGNWDDKAINKAHSAARKYFLLSLFQVPSGDFDDADEGPAAAAKQPEINERAVSAEKPQTRQRTVPGPATPNKQPIVTERAVLPQEPIADERLPHKIGFTPGMTADVWAAAYLKVIGAASSQQEMSEWDGLNDATLQRLSDKYPEVYEQVRAAAEQRMEQLAPPMGDVVIDSAMPDPKEDPGASLNWVAQGLVDSKTLQEAETFWNNMVAPRESEFDPVDWELLLEEFKRNEVRLTPDAD